MPFCCFIIEPERLLSSDADSNFFYCTRLKQKCTPVKQRNLVIFNEVDAVEPHTTNMCVFNNYMTITTDLPFQIGGDQSSGLALGAG